MLELNGTQLIAAPWELELIDIAEKMRYDGDSIIRKGRRMMGNYATMTQEQLLFAVFCIEALSDELGITGEQTYKILVDDSDILDSKALHNLRLKNSGIGA